ncbi:MAG: hypothetical protein NC489_23650 [Ruminococcus flavefaciens]|nr:hypothetical protein [Ruminococcus flavefaciens]
MDKVRLQVLGYRNFNRKSDNKPMSIITAISACTPSDNQHGTFGNKATDFFLPDDLVGTLTPDCVGQEVIVGYSLGNFGRPVVTGLEFRPWK